MSSTVSQEAPRKKTRIAGLFAPADLKGSALLPSDRWIVSNVFDILKTNRELKKSLGRIAGFAALTALAAVAAVAVMFATASVLAIGASTAALMTAVIFAKKTGTGLKNFKKDVLPGVRADIAVRYINAKGAELQGRWKDFFFKKKPPSAEKPVVAKKTAARTPDPKLAALFDAEAFKKAVKEARAPVKQPPATPKPPQP